MTAVVTYRLIYAQASQRVHALRTYGLALNELANLAELSGHPDHALRDASVAALTPADRARLRDGG